MSAAALLEARGVHAWYGSSHVLQGVDLCVGSGETVGLLGRNGMGKSTLIRSLLGIVRQRSGAVTFAGEDVSRAASHEIARRGIAYVPEGRAIFPNLTVRENLVMAARAPREAAATWTLERVLASFPRLASRLSRWGGQLSGGEQQMLAIGRALMTQPRLIVLDEATEGLAPLIVQEVWRVIGEIRDSGVASLIVDRDYRRVGENAARLVVMRKGEVALQGESRALLSGGALAPLLGL
ncbi:MAG TPA: ABC transporter ATP-binding protein [Usitatibacter sp.]|nr:ABC transporter ATP-binding protein [Usitatibacter sp.]